MTDRDKMIAAMTGPIEGERRDPRWTVGEEPAQRGAQDVREARPTRPEPLPTIDSGEVKNDPAWQVVSMAGRPAVACPCGAIKVHEWGFDPMSPCIVCGRPDPRTIKSPFDPEPRPLEKSEWGYRYCLACDAPVSVVGHACKGAAP